MQHWQFLRFGSSCLVLLCVCDSMSALATEHWIATGVAKQDITPNHPVLLGGFGGRPGEHQGIDQKLWARSLAIGRRNPVVLVAVDSGGVPAHVVRRVARVLERRFGVTAARLVVCSTHTHNAPNLPGYAPVVWRGHTTPAQVRRVERYALWLEDMIVKVAAAALADRQDAVLAWGQGQTRFGGNRRALVGGKWRGFGFQRDGPVDHSVPVMTARNRQGSIFAIWVNYACHCTTVGSRNYVSGDWAGCANEEIEKGFPGAVALTTIGCGADVGPQPSGSLKIARRHGVTLGRVVKEVVEGSMETLASEPDAVQKSVRLPLANIPSRAEFERRAAVADYHGQHATLMLERLDQNGELEKTVPYTMTTWRFGKQLGLVFLAGEVVVDYAVRLKTELDGGRIWINAWANDVPSYIPSRRILREGGYEAEFSQIYYGLPASYAPGIEDQIVAEVHQLLGPTFRTGEGQLTRDQFQFPTGNEWLSERLGPWLVELPGPELTKMSRLRRLARVSQSGFAAITSPSPILSTWFNYTGTQQERPFIRQETKGTALAWRTPAVTVTAGKEPVVLLFLGSVGWSSEPATAGFQLSLNGKEALVFDITRRIDEWVSTDARVRLDYFPTWISDVDSAGLFYLQVAAGLLEDQTPVNVRVTSLGAGSKRWFAIDTIRDVKSVEKIVHQALQVRSP